MKQRFSVSLFVFALVLSVLPAAAAENPVQTVVISAVKSDGANTIAVPAEEYISLYNPGKQAVDLLGWEVEYAKSTTPLTPSSCAATDWQDGAGTKRVALDGLTVAGGGTVKIPIGGMLDDVPGAVRIIQTDLSGQTETAITHDVVGWGGRSVLPRCSEGAAAQIPGNDEQLMRCMDMGQLSDTNDNATDFFVTKADALLAPNCPKDDTAAPEQSAADCKSLEITEILPNPKGKDTEQEFIEVHNISAEPVALKSCGIGIADGDEYLFAESMTLAPGEYKALDDIVTGISLPNTKNTELFITSAAEEYAAVTYPAGLKENVSWALIDETWQQTDVLTPSAANKPASPEAPAGKGAETLAPCPAGKFRNPLSGRCKTIVLATEALVPCTAGQVRNPETNRCRKVTASTRSLLPCAVGQVRNPVTNRCRSTALADTALAPCQSGQERNPVTNRCRKVMAATSALKPCDAGEERNPETNRCRKKAAGASASGKDMAALGAGQSKAPINYGVLGIAGALAVGYGLYEYRNDIRNKFVGWRSRSKLDASGSEPES